MPDYETVLPEPVACINPRCRLVVCWPELRGEGLLFAYKLRDLKQWITTEKITVQGRCMGCGRMLTLVVWRMEEVTT